MSIFETSTRGLNALWQALARAVFSQAEIVVLDDPFSALDRKTADRIVSNLLGPSGTFKQLGTTVIVTGNAGKLTEENGGVCEVFIPWLTVHYRSISPRLRHSL